MKEQCLDLKPYRGGREVLLLLREDAGIVQQNATERKTDSEALRIAKAATYCTLGPPKHGKKDGFIGHLKLAAKKPHIPQSLRSLIEIVLGRWSASIKKQSSNVIQNQAALTVLQLRRFITL